MAKKIIITSVLTSAIITFGAAMPSFAQSVISTPGGSVPSISNLTPAPPSTPTTPDIGNPKTPKPVPPKKQPRAKSPKPLDPRKALAECIKERSKFHGNIDFWNNMTPAEKAIWGNRYENFIAGFVCAPATPLVLPGSPPKPTVIPSYDDTVHSIVDYMIP